MTSRTRPGILYHKYGPHIFHTNSEQVVDYLSQFTEVAALRAPRAAPSCADKLVPIPINRTTLNKLFGLDLKTDEEAAEYLASRAEPVDEIRTSEDVVINAVGRELYELFFRGYTRKQWGLDPSELDKQVTVAHPDADQHRRPLFQRHVPGHAARRLHHDVREDARPSADRGAHGRRLPRAQGSGARDRRPHHLHRADRRIFRLPLRQAAVPEPASSITRRSSRSSSRPSRW